MEKIEDNEKLLKIDKLENMYKDESSMSRFLYFEDINKIEKRSMFIFMFGFYMAFLLGIAFSISLGVLGVLLSVLMILFLLLYRTIIDDIVIPDKCKEIFRRGYILSGYIKDSSRVIKIKEIFFDREKINDIIENKKKELKEINEN